MPSLQELPTTDSGTVRKKDAMNWLASLADDSPFDPEHPPTADVVAKDPSHTGSTYPTPITNIRITGSPESVEAMAKRFVDFLGFENHRKRLEVSLKEVEDRDSGEPTGNYALYLGVAYRG